MKNKNKIIPSKDFFEKIEKKSEISVLADGIISPENAGAIIRLCANFGIKKLYFYKTNFSSKKANKFSSTSYKFVDIEYIYDSSELNKILINKQVVAVDTVNNAIEINKFDFSRLRNFVLVVGNEKHGICNEVLNFATHSVFINTTGKVKSMNVSNALAVVVYKTITSIC